MRKLFTGLLFAVSLVLLPTAASAAPAETQPDVVLDEIGFFSNAQEKRITEEFADVTTRYGILPVVEVVQNLGGEAPQRYAIRRANELGIGDAGADNGLYVLFSLDERELRVEPGIGLARVVTEDEIQLAIDNQIIPQFKNGDQTAGVIAGVQAIGEYSTMNTPAEAPSAPLPPLELDATPLFIGLGVVGGAGVLGLGTYLTLKARKRARDAAEKLRKDGIAEEVKAFTDKLANSPELLSRLAALTNKSARFDAFDSEFRYTSFADDDEKKALFDRLVKLIIEPTVDYSGIDARFYKNTLQEDESVNEYAARILAEKPRAQKALAAAVEAERQRVEEERRRAKRKAEARDHWNNASRSQQEAYALSSSSERQNVGNGMFADYTEAEKSSYYSAFGDALESELKNDAKRAFDNLPHYQREQIARAGSYQREQYLQQYIPGFNPALATIYMLSATSMMNTIQADERRAAEEASAASNASFTGFNSSDTFGGGSFDGSGGGGKW